MAQVDNTVRGVLSGRAPIFLTQEQTIRDAATILSNHNIGAAPVLANDRLVGMFTERDILRRLVAAGRNPETTQVADLMTRAPCTVNTETPLVKAFAVMIEGKFRHLPVVDAQDRVIAILSMRDIPLEHRIMHERWTTWTNGKTSQSAQTAATASD